MNIDDLIRISRKYGGNPEYVIGGGGNTSLKVDDRMYVKASGVDLGTIDAKGFAVMDLPSLQNIWHKQYPEDKEERENEALQDLMDARKSGETNRPSVETLLHSLFPHKLVVHTHPSLVNGMTCGQKGKEKGKELFGDDFFWIPLVDPGYILANTVNEAIQKRLAAGGTYPQITFLENHGVFVAADTEEEADALYTKIGDTLKSAVTEEPDMQRINPKTDQRGLTEGLLKATLPKFVFSFRNTPSLAAMIADDVSLEPLMSAFSPDHIVYCGHIPLVFSADELNPLTLTNLTQEYEKLHGKMPRTFVLKGVGIWGCGINPRASELAAEMFLDAMKVAVYSRSFGGPRFMPKGMVDFINTWEVEKYRTQKSLGKE